MTSESTRFLGQPSETKPTFGRAVSGWFWISLGACGSSVVEVLTKAYFIRIFANFLAQSIHDGRG